ncbi:alpha/beta hydrolase [Paenibacillus sp. J22TS3]|uniref:alpha/beta hydrolase family protein n=1 Tax=Paenibacillus sp. J22TS3 TaxID=2807192 RepID=UPI001B1E6952|nr:alpha/beta hydrolase [Paenibacillus sp. J22TS3]GIP22138.1 carboxylic ester hydrolase [Paenibacillus sp. J22TS3]
MGTLLFFAALIIEIALAAWCIITKQNHKRFKGWLRVAEFLIFGLLILSAIIVWSFRWVLPAVLLLVLAIPAVVSLLRKSALERTYQASRTVVKTVLMILVLTLAFAPVLIFPQYKSPKVTGPYEVATASYTYTDKKRVDPFTHAGNRFVNVEFWYPKNANGTYPLLVFSHGAFGIKSSNSSTYTELASHGYVVVSIDHPYHSFYTVSDDGKVTLADKGFLQEFQNANTDGVYTNKEVYGLFQKWMKLRADDMDFVIDTILEKTSSDTDSLYKLINTSKIGVFGHSMGGTASMWLGRERSDISAVVNIDAPMFSELVYNKAADDFAASGRRYTTPLLNIYSDDVWKQLGRNTIYAANQAADQNTAEMYTVHFQGAKHLSLTDLPLFSPFLANQLQRGSAKIDKYFCIETENALILKFFDYKLKGIGSFNPPKAY